MRYDFSEFLRFGAFSPDIRVLARASARSLVDEVNSVAPQEGTSCNQRHIRAVRRKDF